MRTKTHVASSPGRGGGGGAADRACAAGSADGHAVALRATADIVEGLMRDPQAAIFCRPVDPERDEEDFTMADYLEVISGPPMDLATVMRKFRSGAYPSAQVMREDVVRVWRNAYDFNGPDNPVYERALALSDRFDERFEELVAPPFHHLAAGLSAGDPGWLGRRVRVYWKGEHAFFAGSVHKADRIKVSARCLRLVSLPAAATLAALDPSLALTNASLLLCTTGLLRGLRRRRRGMVRGVCVCGPRSCVRVGRPLAAAGGCLWGFARQLCVLLARR